MTSKKVNCVHCIHYDEKNCHKNGNVGILVKYRQESRFFIKTPKELNKNKDCKYYAKS